MKVLVTGNLGYVGSYFVDYFSKHHPTETLIGLDVGFFPFYGTTQIGLTQLTRDVRDVTAADFEGVSAVVHLAAISNDPMGALDESVTMDINLNGSLQVARMAKAAGVKKMVFASSCSVYGASGNSFRTEDDETTPLTAYARSKVEAEIGLEAIAEDSFHVDCLRFSTAAGASPNLRSDLVVNDLTLGGLRTGRIGLKSDGLAWRPIIDVHDMARAISWSIFRTGGRIFEVINVGSEGNTLTVRDIAEAVSRHFDNIPVEFGPDSSGDNRSYKVSFKKFQEMAPGFQPEKSLSATIGGLEDSWGLIKDLEETSLVRLQGLNRLIQTGQVDSNLRMSS